MERKITVNLHFLRACNYCCKFCFHRGMEDARTLKREQWYQVIDNIVASGKVQRIDLAGGEPFLMRSLCIDLIKYIKSKGVECSVISNSVFIDEKTFDKVKDDLDMIGVSCDSGSDEINVLVGRHNRPNFEGDETKPHIFYVKRIARLCKEHNKYFKVNTVICRENLNDDSIFDLINEIQPMRWKVFRVLKIENENGVEKDEREPYTGYITDDEWNSWIKRCQEKSKVKAVLEDNDDMQTSYVQVDEQGYLLDSSSGSKLRTYNMLENDFGESIEKIGFSKEKFFKRGGFFAINKCPLDIEDL